MHNKIGQDSHHGNDSELSESLDEEALLELERIAAEKEKDRILAEKQEKAF